jgi:hypothetical protein
VSSGSSIQVLRCCAGLTRLTGTQLIAAKIDSNSGVNISDALLILRYCAGLITKFPVQ